MQTNDSAEKSLEQRLVARFGSTGFAALASALWGVPLCFFAGGVEFDARAFWGLYLGIALFPVWVVLAIRARRIERTLIAAEGAARRRRFDLHQMSSSEWRWAVGFGVAMLAIIGWLNAAATVDLGGLAPGLAAGNARVLGFVEAAVLFLVVAIVAAVYCWARNARAYLRRAEPVSEEPAPGS